jgi:hypothetical protein
MSNEIVTTKAFQERVFEKIRADIGNLMTDEELKSLLQQAMQKAFFERVVESTGWRSATDTEPVFVTLIRDLMRDRVKVAVDAWMEENKELVSGKVEEALKAGIAGAVLDHLRDRFLVPLQILRTELEQRGIVDKKY